MYQKTLFQNQVALVTGGRSGIGYGIAEQFLKLGAKVIIASRNAEALQAAADKLSAFGECYAQACDIRQPEQAANLAAEIQAKFTRLDILVNNAGGQFPALAEDISAKGWQTVIDNNLNGTFYMSQEMANTFFIPQKKGVMVNIIANIYRGFPGMAHTGAARAGVENLTKTLACEWARYGIRLNAIAPGTIISSGLETYAPEIQASLEQVRQENLFQRLGTVEDVVNAVCFYASPLSSYVSGTTLYVDGLEHLHSNRMGTISVLEMMKRRREER